MVFASRYADVPVIKAVMDGREYQGRSTFSGHDTLVLSKWGCKILTVRLQGFIFFFTAERLRSDLLHIVASRQLPSNKVQWLIIDFRFVENFDSTSIQKLHKLFRTCEEEFGIWCMVTNLQGNLKARMEDVFGGKIETVNTDIEEMAAADSNSASQAERARLRESVKKRLKDISKQRSKEMGLISEDTSDPLDMAERGHHADAEHGHQKKGLKKLLYFADSDDAVEVALMDLLSQPKYNPRLISKDRHTGRWTLPGIVRGIIDYQRAGLGGMVMGQQFDSCSFRTLGKTEAWQKGDVIQRQGEWSHRTLYYIVSGQVAVFREHTDGSISKTELRHRGTIIGETGFFLDQPRYGTMQCVADNTETVAFTLDSYRQLAIEQPRIAEHFHVYVIEMQTSLIKRQAHEINILLRPALGVAV